MTYVQGDKFVPVSYRIYLAQDSEYDVQRQREAVISFDQ